MKRKIQIMLIIFTVLCLCGCSHKREVPAKVVTAVQITVSSSDRTMRRQYTQPQNVQKVLDYLRLQESLGTADTDPERLTGTVFVIDVALSDGSHSIYYQRGGRYLSKKYHPWQKIDPDRAADFYRILQQTPTDP